MTSGDRAAPRTEAATTPEERQQWTESHREVAEKWEHGENSNYFVRGPWCSACGLRWPCPTVRLLREQEALAAPLDVEDMWRLARAIQCVETPEGTTLPPIQPFYDRAEAYLRYYGRLAPPPLAAGAGDPQTEAGQQLNYETARGHTRPYASQILAIEREAAAAPLDRIDVDRLAKAIEWASGQFIARGNSQQAAEVIAAEYQRLALPPLAAPCRHVPNWNPDDSGYGHCEACEAILHRGEDGTVT